MKIIDLVGTGVFWLFWPVWRVYFKLRAERSRVLVVVGDEMLLLKIWLSPGKYELPGGGKKRGETIERSATRELREETGISAPESALKRLGKGRLVQSGLSREFTWYLLTLDEKPELSPHPTEIIEARWVRMNEVNDLNCNSDVTGALKRYKPTEQASLL